jgi:hypothetical protein
VNLHEVWVPLPLMWVWPSTVRNSTTEAEAACAPTSKKTVRSL